MTQSDNPVNRTRQRIASEAARLLASQQCRDYKDAVRKAAENLGYRHGGKDLPDLELIEQALTEYQQLFGASQHTRRLRRLRELAVEAMKMLEPFQPRLVGPVLSGTADANDPVRLQVFADTPEELAMHLMERKIPWIQRDVTLRYTGGKKNRQPLFSFQAGDTEIDLLVLPRKELRNPPLDPLGERPEKGASLGRVRSLVDKMRD